MPETNKSLSSTHEEDHWCRGLARDCSLGSWDMITAHVAYTEYDSCVWVSFQSVLLSHSRRQGLQKNNLSFFSLTHTLHLLAFSKCKQTARKKTVYKVSVHEPLNYGFPYGSVTTCCKVPAYFFSAICNERWAQISFGDTCGSACHCICDYTLAIPPPHTLPYYPRTINNVIERTPPPGGVSYLLCHLIKNRVVLENIKNTSSYLM